jgi:xanthine dehydrogenase accessory factor
MPMITLLRGGGDLASGVALRLFRAGLWVVIAELPQPLMVRRSVSFGEAIYQGEAIVEGVVAQRAETCLDMFSILEQGKIPVIIDPALHILPRLRPLVLIDGRMTKQPENLGLDVARLVVGLGPGYVAGENCHAVVETKRGHRLGRVIWQGPPDADTGIPEEIGNRREERVLRAPCDGLLQAHAAIGDRLEPGQLVAEVSGHPVIAPFRGVLRGLVHPGIEVQQNLKIGDLDPRDDPQYCWLVSEKSLAIGGGVLEAILSQKNLRNLLWD